MIVHCMPHMIEYSDKKLLRFLIQSISNKFKCKVQQSKMYSTYYILCVSSPFIIKNTTYNYELEY